MGGVWGREGVEGAAVSACQSSHSSSHTIAAAGPGSSGKRSGCLVRGCKMCLVKVERMQKGCKKERVSGKGWYDVSGKGWYDVSGKGWYDVSGKGWYDVSGKVERMQKGAGVW